MKFCKNLQRIVDISDPEWAPYWINYKMLKKLIKELPSLTPDPAGSRSKKKIDDIAGNPGGKKDLLVKDNLDQPTSPTSTDRSKLQEQQDEHEQPRNITIETGSDTFEKDTPVKDATATAVSVTTTPTTNTTSIEEKPGEVAFFKLLHSELRKATHFFAKAEQEFTIRQDRIVEGMDIMKRHNAIMVNDRWSLLARSLYKLYKDLLLLETFAIMTYCSFSKILKKHDKVTGYITRAAFMSKVVHKANFTNYPNILSMIDKCGHLYEEVSEQLLSEGKESLLEDERLFINMIHQLNEQVLGNDIDEPDSVGSVATSLAQRKTYLNRQGLSSSSADRKISGLVIPPVKLDEDVQARTTVREPDLKAQEKSKAQVKRDMLEDVTPDSPVKRQKCI